MKQIVLGLRLGSGLLGIPVQLRAKTTPSFHIWVNKHTFKTLHFFHRLEIS